MPPLRHDAATVPIVVVAFLVLLALLGTAAAAVIRPAWGLVALLLGLEALWVLINGPVEGEVLVRLTADHGITVADLLVPATLPVLAFAVLRLRPVTHRTENDDRPRRR